MSTMDLKHKGITWVGNLYEKFEAMCLEVEDIVCQETTKMVENQAQLVGVSVKNFYAELMQDLLPPSEEDPEKSKEGIEKNPIMEELPLEKELKAVSLDGKDLTQESSFRVFPNISHLPPNSEEPITGTDADISIEQNENHSVLNGKQKVAVEEFIEEEKLSSPKVLEVMAPPRNDLSGANKSDGKMCYTEPTMTTLASINAAQYKSTGEVGKIHHELSDAVGGTLDAYSASPGTLVIPATYFNNEKGVGQTPSRGSPAIESNGGSDCYNGEQMAAHSDAARSDDEIVDACQGLRLEDSCIMVDCGELHLVSQRTGKNRSYKKKLRDAFASRIRSGKKLEYERLARLCGDANTGTNNQLRNSRITTLSRELDSKQSATHDFCDSEWEFL